MTDTFSAPTKLQVSPSTDLAGYHYETDVGRYTVFFWQEISNFIYASILLKKDSSWVPVQLAIPVATDAKKNTPITAVNWSNGLNAAVYYLDAKNNIHERVTGDDGITWRYGELSALSVPTRSFSDLTAVISWDTLNAIYIKLYFQDSRNLIRELQLQVSVNEGHWSEKISTGGDKLYAMGGTRIACTRREGIESVITQHVQRGVQKFWQNAETNSNWTIAQDKNYFNQNFDRGTRLGYTGDKSQERFYAYDSGTVTERVWEWLPKAQWHNPTILSTSTGTSRIFPNFIVLSWPPDMDSSCSEVHLFSMDESGRLWDYLVGLGTEKSVSLLEA